MANPHPFYRFSKAWNAGFFPDNQIMSDLLNEIRNDLVTYVGGNPWSGKTINQWYNLVKQFINTYTQSPYFGEFDFTIQKISDIPNWEYNINIFNPDLTATTAGQVVTINGFFNNTTQQVVNANVNAFTPGSYSVNVDVTLIQEEVKAREALRVVDLNGSAFFPITYKYNPTTFAATAGLARAKDLQLLNGEINRLPPATWPYKNQRIFELPELNGDDTYIISIIERIIQASLDNTDYTTSVLAAYNSFAMPDGWVKSVNYPSFTTYERVQFNFVNASRRKFILVGRMDGNWLWQRFLSDEYGNPVYNFLTAYTESNLLPYEPLQAGRWLYNDDTFDFEFVEFTSGCYVSEEFYAMPAKPGDQMQFNVWDANLEGIDSVLVGLFEQDGTFIQQIGNAVRPTNCTCSYTFTHTYTEEEFDTFRVDINSDIITPPQIYYTGFYLFLNGEIAFSTEEILPNDFLTDAAETIAYLESLSNSNFVISGTINEDNSVTFSVVLLTSNECQQSQYHGSFQTGIIPGNEEYSPQDITQFEEVINECCNTVEQLQASVTIPSKKGCYRMGLFNPPTEECELTFRITLDDDELESYLIACANLFNTENPYLGFTVGDGTIYVMPIDQEYTPNIEFAEIIAEWVNANIPGMTATVGFNTMTFNWVVTVPCGTDYKFISGQTQESGETVEGFIASELQNCECTYGFELYSLSNIINIDASDCFSTMIEFWQDSDSIAQGFEYFNGWKQRVRIGLNGGGEKPIIEESLYRQSNGVTRRPQNKQDLSVDLHTDFFDLDTQLAMTDATRYPYLIWEGKSIFVRGDVEVATTQDFTNQSSFETLSQMKFQALIQGFQPRNSSCLTC